ncbi:AcrR family transcriptional regulator [Streptosporangium album]|uniref:AcrR family transcriptional regulator n=1 Tax=Streptosporangium album TaxID=47479 RepID=A0A7W7S2I5_9ACTN|nr:TetR/AcrR family transcriptional regulator [Streptosporangium album]MBB4942700.1 AcrR family transcriptional regulator [Streptosporangium album]
MKSKRTEAELKDAARRLLTRTSYAEIKITDITAEAGKAVGSFYRYFEDKDALLTALAGDFQAALRSRVVEQLGHEHGISTIEDVRHHVRAFWSTYREHLPEIVGIFQASMSNGTFRHIHDELRERQVEHWTRHILAAGGRTEDAARLSALAVTCMLEYFCYHRLAEHPGGDDDEAIATLTQLIAQGLLGGVPA